eukprot:NODE_16200_length_1007_cov_2.539773.p1 GENE.NODE_16200_length_1007_cov_2.539773~~NODE_16200_length_1007_cov_2.539773.p1  ORF type:complete len:161 (-),score=59.99 NODE_16200_length_1007_cov_2.539773:524-1006(-)
MVKYDGVDAALHPRELLERFVSQPDGFAKLVVYYAGHADKSGAWCLRWKPEGQSYSADVTLAPRDLFGWKAALNPHIPLEVIVEAPYAGAWCVVAKEVQLLGRVLTACAPDHLARAQAGSSLFTDWLIGRGRTLKTARFTDGPQEPWEYTRLGTAGPLRI